MYQALSYYCIRPQATSVCGRNLLRVLWHDSQVEAAKAELRSACARPPPATAALPSGRDNPPTATDLGWLAKKAHLLRQKKLFSHFGKVKADTQLTPQAILFVYLF